MTLVLNKKTIYGTLADLSLEMGLKRGTLKMAKHRHPDRFPEPHGTIGGHDVYLLSDMQQFHSAHNRVGVHTSKVNTKKTTKKGSK
jgi:hypothetical protein